MIADQVFESAKLRAGSLEAELRDWLTLTAPGGVLQKNNSQMVLVQKTFDTTLVRLRNYCTLLSNATPQAGISNQNFMEIACIDKIMREAFDLWGAYRTWFSQRFVGRFQSYLLATDGIAHDCYRAVAERLKALGINIDLRSYPITSFDGRYDSPYTIARGKRFRANHIQTLPVPMIAVPWNLQTLSWNSLAIHHEVGHDLDVDLGMPSKEIADHLGSELLKQKTVDLRVQAWQRWSKEIVADYFGVLLGGPAYLGFIAEYLARHPSDSIELGGEELHPVPYLRILLVAKFVQRVWGPTNPQVAAYVDGICTDWRNIYPKVQQYIVDFEKDFDLVVDAFQNLPLNCLTDRHGSRHPLADLCPHEHALFTKQNEAASFLLGDLSCDMDLKSPRLIPGAAQLAFERNTAHQSLNDRTIEAIVASIPDGQLGEDDDEDRLHERLVNRFVNELFTAFGETGV